MSLTNPNTPVSQQDLQDFYHKLLPYMGGSSGGQTIQVETLPTASADELGNVYQYIGATGGTYTHGFFYECVSDGESTPTYSWEQTSVQPSTGGGHTIEDSEGTDLTQRDTLQFGEGFLVEDDNTNEKTVIKPRLHKYSTSEQVVGEWIDGKPIYEKTIHTGAFPSNSEKDVTHGISNIENIITYFGFAKRNDNVFSNIPISSNASSELIQTDCNLTNIRLITGYNAATKYIDSYITLQYTKTTD